MPLVRIDLVEGKSEQYRAQVGDILYQTLVDVLNVPEHDRFHVITEHTKASLPSIESISAAVADWQAGGVLLIRSDGSSEGSHAEATLAPRKVPLQHDESYYIGRTCLPTRFDFLDDLQGP